MTYRKWTVRPDGLTDLLNNARVVGPFTWSGVPLGGKTLVFTEPSATVTFPGKDGDPIALPEAIAAIRAQIPDLHIDTRAGSSSAAGPTKYLSLYRDDGLGIGKDGTANDVFGFSKEADTRIKPPVPESCVKSISRIGLSEYEVVAGGSDADWDDPQPASLGAKK